MSFEEYVAIGAGVLILLVFSFGLYKRFPRRVKRELYVVRWKKLQQRLPDRSQWRQAIIEADDLLAEALQKKRFKGKSTGERMVEAQKIFTNNDAVWFGHKLRTRLDASPETPLRQEDVQKALYGLREGLKDIGAL